MIKMTLLYRRSKLRILSLVCVAFIITIIYGSLRRKNLKLYHTATLSNPNLQLNPGMLHSNNDTYNNHEIKDSLNRPRSYTLKEMKQRAANLNFFQRVVNSEKFGNHSPDVPVIVIQTHDRPNIFKYVLESLKIVEGIENATVVISRDKFTPDMDNLIDNIRFCRYVEIFFPFSMQLYPDKFPGQDLNDCPRDISKSDAIKKKCNNAEFPDMYGHYREVKFVQIKHHWFWKLNMVFSGIKDFMHQTGPILFIEEDHFVVPDLIHIMKKALHLKDTSCKECKVITLGAYDILNDYKNLGSQFHVKGWESSKHNIGMILDKHFFGDLTQFSNEFCNYDDYNWDWSLQFVGSNHFMNGFSSMISESPHVFHIGCDGFHKTQTCDIEALYNKYKELTKKIDMFPSELKIVSTNPSRKPPVKPNGGWGDVRDHALCKNYQKLCQFDL